MEKEIISFYSGFNRDPMNWSHSGNSLIEKIPTDAHIIDVGCGNNDFKSYFPNLTGIDPASDKADIKCWLHDFNSDKLFDVALCLGSVHFGSRIDVIKSIELVDSLIKPGGKLFFRTIFEESPINNNVIYYNWRVADHTMLAQHLGYDIIEIVKETNPFIVTRRLYAEWKKR